MKFDRCLLLVAVVAGGSVALAGCSVTIKPYGSGGARWVPPPHRHVRSRPAPVVRSDVGIVVVRPGDTLYGIAWRYRTPVATIVRLNRLNSTRLYTGQRLLVPQYPYRRRVR